MLEIRQRKPDTEVGSVNLLEVYLVLCITRSFLDTQNGRSWTRRPEQVGQRDHHRERLAMRAKLDTLARPRGQEDGYPISSCRGEGGMPANLSHREPAFARRSKMSSRICADNGVISPIPKSSRASNFGCTEPPSISAGIRRVVLPRCRYIDLSTFGSRRASLGGTLDLQRQRRSTICPRRGPMMNTFRLLSIPAACDQTGHLRLVQTSTRTRVEVFERFFQQYIDECERDDWRFAPLNAPDATGCAAFPARGPGRSARAKVCPAAPHSRDRTAAAARAAIRSRAP